MLREASCTGFGVPPVTHGVSAVYLVVSRDDFLDVRYSTAVCVPVYSARRTRVEAKLPLGPAEGLKHAELCADATN